MTVTYAICHQGVCGICDVKAVKTVIVFVSDWLGWTTVHSVMGFSPTLSAFSFRSHLIRTSSVLFLWVLSCGAGSSLEDYVPVGSVHKASVSTNRVTVANIVFFFFFSAVDPTLFKLFCSAVWQRRRKSRSRMYNTLNSSPIKFRISNACLNFEPCKKSFFIYKALIINRRERQSTTLAIANRWENNFCSWLDWPRQKARPLSLIDPCLPENQINWTEWRFFYDFMLGVGLDLGSACISK